MAEEKHMEKVSKALEQAKQEQQKRWQPINKELEQRYVATKPAEVALDPRLIAYYDSHAAVTEQLRAIRTSVQSRTDNQAAQILVVTSSIKGEGKSFIAANMAIVFSEFPEKKVLIMDCDLRRSSQHLLFGLNVENGLVELLLERCKLDETIYSTPIDNLSVMPSGSRKIKPTVLLSTSKMKELLKTLRAKYHWIIIDSSPVIPVTDTNIVGQMTDGAVLVIKMGHTQREIVERAKKTLEEANTKILGCILNQVEYHIPRYIYRYV